MKWKRMGIACLNEVTLLFGAWGSYLAWRPDYLKETIGGTFLLLNSSVWLHLLLGISSLAWIGLYYNRQRIWIVAFTLFNAVLILTGTNYAFAGRLLGTAYLFTTSFLSITREMRFSASQLLIKPTAIKRKTREELKREYFDGD